MIYILIFFVILLDYLLIYFIPSYFNNLYLFYPMLTLTLTVFLYKKVDNKNYLKTVFLIGIIYDFLFSYIFLFNSLIFLMFAKLIKKIYKYLRCNLITQIILVICFIFIYDLFLFLLIRISNYNNVLFIDLVYKVKNSILLNITFYCFLYISSRKVKYFKKM